MLYLLIGFFLAIKQKVSQVVVAKIKNNNERVMPYIYDSDYYLYSYSGNEKQYILDLDKMPISLKRCFDYGFPKPGEKILDLGCGRGHLAYYCVMNGCIAVAIDYSKAAIDLANKTRNALPENLRSNMIVKEMDFRDLKADEKYDVIFMADLVEHLYDWQLKELFKKVKEILKEDTGRIVIHTAPNKTWINIIFPLKRILNWLSVVSAKKDFFYTRGKYNYDENMHVNEQTTRDVRKLLRDFEARVWCDDGSSNVISLLTKHFAGADIWAMARLKNKTK